MQDAVRLSSFLWQRQPVSGNLLDSVGLDDLVSQVDGDLLPSEGGNVHQHPAQRLHQQDSAVVTKFPHG